VTRTNKILLAVVAAGLAVCAFYFLLLAPQREEVAKLDKDVAAKQAELTQAQQTLAGYEQARKTYKSNYTTLARLGKAVPADDDVRSLMVQLEDAASRSGVDFEKIELGTGLAGGGTSTPAPTDEKPAAGGLASAPGAVPVAGGALSAMPFNFTFNGEYFDLQSFLAKLEHFVTVNNARVNATGRLLRLESLSIAPAQSGFPHMQAQIGAATYLVPPTKGVAGDQPAAGATPSTPSDPGSTPPTTTATAGAAR
jgi:Tfp pilus assembly protein PilO